MEVDGTIVFFNEAEAVCNLDAPEPEDLAYKPERKKKQSGKKAADVAGLTVHRIDHYLNDAELEAEFGKNGWKQLPDAVTRCYKFVPAKMEGKLEARAGCGFTVPDSWTKNTRLLFMNIREPGTQHIQEPF